MESSSKLSTAAKITVLGLFCITLFGGWLVVLSGGFNHMPHRYSKEVIFVGGLMGQIMAGIFFALSTISLSVLLQAFRCSRFLHVAFGALVIIPPILFVVFQ